MSSYIRVLGSCCFSVVACFVRDEMLLDLHPGVCGCSLLFDCVGNGILTVPQGEQGLYWSYQQLYFGNFSKVANIPSTVKLSCIGKMKSIILVQW